nr:hypothetical protein [Tanacetum cinerariifolium]
MSLSHIYISSNSMDESIRSYASHVILSDSKAAATPIPVVLPDVTPEVVVAFVAPPARVLNIVPETETEPVEALPLSNYISASLDYVQASPYYMPASTNYTLGLDTESELFEADTKESAEEDPSEDFSFEDGTSEVAEPLPALIVPAPPTSP